MAWGSHPAGQSPFPPGQLENLRTHGCWLCRKALPAPEQVNVAMSAAGEENHQLTETPRTSRQVHSQRTYNIHETTLHTLRKFNRDTGDTTTFVTLELKTRAEKLHWDGQREHRAEGGPREEPSSWAWATYNSLVHAPGGARRAGGAGKGL